ncbi:MAG: hypothetical protein K8F30_14540, partial [Taibaiella sp.]|nr:hypothetical protein [Taibaiella sp.]
IKALIAHHAAAKGQITSYKANYSYTIHTSPTTEGTDLNVDPSLITRDTSSDALIIRQGNCYRLSCHRKSNTNAEEWLENIVLNEKSFVKAATFLSQKDQPTAITWVEHTGLDSLDEIPLAKSAQLNASPEPITYGFTTAPGDLLEFYKYKTNQCLWNVEEVEDLYLLKRTLFVNERPKTIRSYSLSPREGFLLKEVKVERLADGQETTISCTFQQVDTCWFPKTVVVHSNEGVYNLQQEMTIEDVVINCPFAESEFSFDAMQVPLTNATMRKHLTNGKMIDYIVADGKFIPK